MTTKKPDHISHSPSVRGRVWLTFHLWTVAAVALLFAGNVATALRPFENPNNRATRSSQAPLIVISSSSPSGSSIQRQPASETESFDYLVDIQLGCDASKELVIPTNIRQIRLRLADCRADSKTSETYYIRNETNGFEATVFKIPDTRRPASPDLVSTDYISLESGENNLRISRSQGEMPSREQTIQVRRR